MKNVLLFLLALVIVYVVWHIIGGLIAGLVGLVITVGMIALFCFLVYTVYRAMTRQKI